MVLKMESMVYVRKALIEELAWINSKYDEIGFQHSAFDHELIVVGEINGEASGLGRRVEINPETAELGGIYVFPSKRGHSLAEKIVSFLIEQSTSYQTVYCIPFIHLKSFYMKFGFEESNDLTRVPDEIKSKLKWCGSTYETQTCLLVKKKPA